MKVLAGLFLCGLSITLLAQQSALSSMPPVETQPKAHFITSGDWPLKWISQTFTEEDQLREVVLRNISSQTITGFQLGWALFIPEGCGVREAGIPRRETHLAPYEARMVKPGDTVTAGPYHLSSESIATFARRAHSPAVVAQIGLYHVRYTDGGETISTFEQLGTFGPEAYKYPCQAKQVGNPNAAHAFTSPDGVFQFKYSEVLVHCTQKNKQPGRWFPNDYCESYIPVCDEPGSQGHRYLVCFAYPRDRFEDSNFEAATFSVAELEQAISEKDCLSAPDWVIDPRGSGGTEIINGVQFKVFEISDAATSHSLHGHVYRTFHENKCYQVSVKMTMTSAGAFDAGAINEFTREDWSEVHGRLQQALDSFRFLK